MVTTLLAVLALIVSLIGLALQLTSSDAIRDLGEDRKAEIAKLKRKIAQQLLYVAVIFALAVVSLPFVGIDWVGEPAETIPWSANAWIAMCLLTVALGGGAMISCARLAFALRDSNVLSVSETLQLLVPLRSKRRR